MKTRRLIVIGEAPAGVGLEPQPALEGRAGRRLAKMMGVSYARFLNEVDRRNLFEAPADGLAWDYREAKLSAMRMSPEFRSGDSVVVLGQKVSRAFGLVGSGVVDLPEYRWFDRVKPMSGITYAIARVPHPSGRSRKLNDPSELARMTEFLAEAWRDRA